VGGAVRVWEASPLSNNKKQHRGKIGGKYKAWPSDQKQPGTMMQQGTEKNKTNKK
jgi:hypothetical protein